MSSRSNTSRGALQPGQAQHVSAQIEPPLRILIVDDHAIIRDGLKQILADGFRGAHLADAADGKEALKQLEASSWDIILLDLSMPGQSGLDILKQAKSLRPKAGVLVLTMHPESQYALRVFKAGAAGYLTKETAAAEVVAAIKKVLAGGKYVSERLAQKLVSSFDQPPEKAPHEILSDRELQVMCLIARGKTLKEIAFDLNLSIKTVSTYRTRLLTKFNFKTNSDLVRYALEEKLIQ